MFTYASVNEEPSDIDMVEDEVVGVEINLGKLAFPVVDDRLGREIGVGDSGRSNRGTTRVRPTLSVNSMSVWVTTITGASA